MGVIERLQTNYDARYQVPVLEYSPIVSVIPKLVFFTDFAYGDIWGDALDPLTIPYPNVVNPGDTLISVIGGRSSGWTVPPPTGGWTVLYSNAVGGNAALSIMWKVADGTEGGTTYEVTQSSARFTGAGTLAFSGLDQADLLEDVQEDSAYDAEPICPDATVGNSGALVLRLYARRLNSAPVEAEDTLYPPTLTGVWDQFINGLDGSCCGVAFQKDVPAGATGTASWGTRTGGTNAWISATLVLNKEQ